MRFTIDNKSKNIITISLGDIGSISRLVFPALGSLITYAYLNKPSGPGQRPLDELCEHLRTYYPRYNPVARQSEPARVIILAKCGGNNYNIGG